MQKVRPKHLDLTKIRLPWPGKVSILHRVSGVAMFLGLPFLLYLLQLSLSSPEVYASCKQFLTHPLVKLVMLGFIWAFMHHLCAGIRFLALDLHKGIQLHTARTTAKAVLVISLVLTAVLGGVLLS
ncbi:succinate dehydrogenase, cytochrome b556 subunit [Leeia sp.]|uniref:succinate dehydrogenase, cytochrome b556 subunit n=1 Tax=Leeia sp. TaxID=2884678 RepID=UPI0035ADC376